VPNQIQIEALIVEVTTSSDTELSADSAYMRLVRGIERSGSIQRAGITTSQMATGDLVTVPMADSREEPDNLRGAPAFDTNEDPADGAQILPGLMASFDVIDGDWGTFYLNLRMLLTEGVAEIVSRPIVLVVEDTPAEIHAGTEVPYQSIKYKSPTNLELNVVWKPVGVRLRVTPSIEPPDRIKLDITEVSVSALLRYENIRGVEMPLFQSREESTVAFVKDGSTLVIGGLLADTTHISATKVPLLGDIPLLGFFFRGTSSVRERTDLYIIMRPSIIRPGEPATLRDFEHLDEALIKYETMVSRPQ
jgi:general secretion pathway protein D